MMLENVSQRGNTESNSPAPSVKESRRQRAEIRTATLLTNARLLVAHGENELALNLLRQASNLESTNPAVLRPLADLLEKTGRLREALIATKALVKFDYGVPALVHHANLLANQNQDEAALNAYYEALSLVVEEHGALFDIHKNMGNIFVRKGDFESAEECYNKAYALNPSSDVLMVNFGTLEVQRGDLGRSLACFRQAVDLNPSNDKAWTGLAMVHNQFGDIDLAWGNLERAMDLAPGNRTAIHLAANWAVRDQTPQRALERMENYLASVEEDEEMSLVLVNLFCTAGRLDLASMESSRVLAWNPGREDVRDIKNRIEKSLEA